MRRIDIRDILPRRVLPRDRSWVAKMIAGNSIMVTGAGGFIGRELCKQIAAYQPAALWMIDNCEFNLYCVSNEIDGRAVLADVRDQQRVIEVFAEAKPTVVFHAAALKHVPLGEGNASEFSKTNFFGTANIETACTMVNARMVLISTDKAVDPVCAMGRTKRDAEIHCMKNGHTIVRFGNVLGSTGSVVPLFEKQIASGGPVTITDKDMTRYFMSVDEAVELTLQAATFEPSTYVLDMGQPVNIMHLAEDMIRLAEKMPHTEIPISVVGVRPGERLHEKLFFDNERVKKTSIDGVLEAELG